VPPHDDGNVVCLLEHGDDALLGVAWRQYLVEMVWQILWHF
jgi:hypothetical protein